MNELQQEVRDLAYANYKLNKQINNMNDIMFNLCIAAGIEADPSKGIPVKELFEKINELTKDECEGD